MKKIIDWIKKNYDAIMCVIGGVLAIICLVFEFVPVKKVLHTIVLSVTAVYFLVSIVWFSLKNKNK